MQTSATIATTTTEALLATMSRRGEDCASVVAKAGLARSALVGDRAPMMPLATFTTILEAVAAERASATVGLDLGEAFPIEALGPIASLFLTSRTVGDALDKFTRYFPSLQSNTRSALSVEDGTARLAYSIVDPTVRFRVQDANFTLAMEYSMLTAVLGHGWRTTCVDFEHLPAEDVELYRTHFACPIRFGRRENAISFPAAYLDVPIMNGDPAANERFERQLVDAMTGAAIRLDLVAGLEAWMIACLMHAASISVEHAASDFGMSLRSFQRKLAESGVSYVEVRNRVRLQVARCMLAETDNSVTAIALHLGYSETSAFSRAFRQQTGASPWLSGKRNRDRPLVS
jgi:AraC-like DNA-binding protein